MPQERPSTSIKEDWFIGTGVQKAVVFLAPVLCARLTLALCHNLRLDHLKAGQAAGGHVFLVSALLEKALCSLCGCDYAPWEQ